MSLFKPSNTNALQSTELFGYRVSTSLAGKVIPIVYGRNRVTGNTIWTGAWQAKPVSGGKLKSGKGGQQQYDYLCALLIGLCQGPIDGVFSVWSDKDQYNLAYVGGPGGAPPAQYTVAGSSYTYTTPQGGAVWYLNNGVTRADSYSETADEYGRPLPTTLTGTQQTPMSLVPSSPGAGQYTLNVDVSGAHYQFSAADAGKVMSISYTYMVNNFSLTSDPLTHLNLVLFNGAAGQAPWNWMISNFPGQALGYTQLAYVGSALFDLGSAGVIPNLSFEIQGRCTFPGGGADANPADIINDILTNSLDGVLGFSSTYLPSTSETFGLGSAGELYTYCAANGILLSPALDTQSDARTIINDLLLAANADAFWSEGMLKFRSYGDTTAVANGFTFTPNTQPEYDVDDDDLICQPGEEPVKKKIPDVRDVNNEVTVEWVNRAMSYAQTPATEQDFNQIQLYGRRPKSSVSMHSICHQAIASQVAATIVRRAVYIEGAGQFELTLPIHFGRLDPMDLFTLEEDYIFQGSTPQPLRIVSIEEDENLALKFTLEPYPWSCSAPTLYAKQQSAPKVGFFAFPGPVNTPMFIQLPAEFTQGNEYTLGIALSGTINWGGAAIYVSTDGGNSYTFLGLSTGAATMGTLSSALAWSSDPDTTTHDLKVDLTESFGQLSSYTQAQADAFVSLIAVDSEILSYKTADLVSAYHYALTYLRRGVYGTDRRNHAVGAPFCVLDSGLFQWNYDASVIGTTVYFKFCSVNQAGQNQVQISQAVAYPVFVSGPRLPYPWSPGYAVPLVGDAVYPKGASGKGTFGLQPVYGTDGHGDPTVGVAIKGIPPITLTSQLLQPPVISCVVGTAGSLPEGTYEVAVSAFDTATPYRNTDFSNIVPVVIPSGGTGSIAVTIAWPTGANGGDVYLASPSGGVGGWHQNQSVASGVTSAVITAFAENTAGGPDAVADHLGVQWFKEVHGGPWAQQVQAVSASTVTIGGAGMTTDQWAGRVVMLLAKYDYTLELPVLNLPILHSSASDIGTGMFTLTIGPNSAGQTLPDLTTLLAIGDLLVMRNSATFTATSLTDTSIPNPYFPTGDTGIEKGHLIMMTGGIDEGDVQAVASITESSPGSGLFDTMNLVGQFLVTPHAGDPFIVVEPSISPEQPSKPILAPNNTLSMQVAVSNLPNPNEDGQVWVFQVKIEDSDGNSTPIRYAPMREIYLFPAQGMTVVVST